MKIIDLLEAPQPYGLGQNDGMGTITVLGFRSKHDCDMMLDLLGMGGFHPWMEDTLPELVQFLLRDVDQPKQTVEQIVADVTSNHICNPDVIAQMADVDQNDALEYVRAVFKDLAGTYRV